jgi:hypothetical protein
MSETFYTTTARPRDSESREYRLHSVAWCPTLHHATGVREATTDEVRTLDRCKECCQVPGADDKPGATGPHYRAALRHGADGGDV